LAQAILAQDFLLEPSALRPTGIRHRSAFSEMALSLQCLSRTACRQQTSFLALSPQVLGAATPRTPARSPEVAAGLRGSPFFAEMTPTASPKGLNFFQESWQTPTSRSPAGLLSQARAAAAAQQELAAAARPAAEDALKHFLARRSRRAAAPPASDDLRIPKGLLGQRLAVAPAGGRRCFAAPALSQAHLAKPSLPVLLGSRPAPEAAAPRASLLEETASAAERAEEARQTFLARQHRIKSRSCPTVP